MDCSIQGHRPPLLPEPLESPTGSGHDVIRRLIADAVHDVIQMAFPQEYPNLCHAYAVVGSSLASIVLGREYRPVAGLAIIDAGNGNFLALTNDSSFSNPIGGNYHCWIHSCPDRSPGLELVDLTFRNNKAYADAHGIPWAKSEIDFLWGAEADINVGGRPLPTPPSYGEGRAWYCETAAGTRWMNCELSTKQDAYIKLTSLALRYLRNLSGEGVIPS
jgi:hypothetical protein